MKLPICVMVAAGILGSACAAPLQSIELFTPGKDRAPAAVSPAGQLADPQRSGHGSRYLGQSGGRAGGGVLRLSGESGAGRCRSSPKRISGERCSCRRISRSVRSICGWLMPTAKCSSSARRCRRGTGNGMKSYFRSMPPGRRRDVGAAGESGRQTDHAGEVPGRDRRFRSGGGNVRNRAGGLRRARQQRSGRPGTADRERFADSCIEGG